MARCQHSLEAEDSALTSSPNDVINKCPPDYAHARYLACRGHSHGVVQRPRSSLCQSVYCAAEQDEVVDTLDVVTSHRATHHAGDVDDDVSRRRVSTSSSRCHCGAGARQCHVTQFGTFASPPPPPPPPPPMAPPT